MDPGELLVRRTAIRNGGARLCMYSKTEITKYMIMTKAEHYLALYTTHAVYSNKLITDKT